MKKVWTYISSVLFGIVIGICIGAKWISGDRINIDIDKIKSKRNAGTVKIDVPVEVNKRKRGKK